MEKLEFKVGDKVRIKSRDELEKLQNRNTTSIVITEEMKSYGGAVGTVEKTASWYYYLSVDECGNMWLPEWVEPIRTAAAGYLKLKKGDYVRVKDEAVLRQIPTVMNGMYKYAGIVARVMAEEDEFNGLILDVDGGVWKWSSAMLEKTNRVYMYGVPGRGDEVIALLRQLGGCNVHGLSGENEGLYFIAPSGNISFVDAYRESADVLREQYKMVVLPPMEPEEEEEEQETEKTEEADEALYAVVHDNRCVRRLMYSREEAEHFRKWVLKDKPKADVKVYRMTEVKEAVYELPF